MSLHYLVKYIRIAVTWINYSTGVITIPYTKCY